MPSDVPDLGDPVQLAVRGDRMDVLGWWAAVELILAGEDPDERLQGRGKHVAEQISDHLRRNDNFGDLTKAMKKADDDGDIPEFRGVDVDYRPFDPKHPDIPHRFEHVPPLEEADQYAIVGRDTSGFFAVGWPSEMDPVDGYALASFLRSYARKIEEEIDSVYEGAGDER